MNFYWYVKMKINIKLLASALVFAAISSGICSQNTKLRLLNPIGKTLTPEELEKLRIAQTPIKSKLSPDQGDYLLTRKNKLLAKQSTFIHRLQELTEKKKLPNLSFQEAKRVCEEELTIKSKLEEVDKNLLAQELQSKNGTEGLRTILNSDIKAVETQINSLKKSIEEIIKEYKKVTPVSNSDKTKLKSAYHKAMQYLDSLKAKKEKLISLLGGRGLPIEARDGIGSRDTPIRSNSNTKK